MATDVFISYCRENSADADRICQFLEQNNVSCWMAPRNIPGGMEWPEAIVEGIKGSRILLVLLSASTQRSKQIGRELTLASDNDLTVITVRLDDVPAPDKLQYFTSNLQWIDAFGDRFNDGLAKLIATLRFQLGRPQTPVAPKVRFSPSSQPVQPRKASKGKKIAVAAVLGFLAFCIIAYFVGEGNRVAYRSNPGIPTSPIGGVTQPPAETTSPARTKPAVDTGGTSAAPSPTPGSQTVTATELAQATAGTWAGTYVCGGLMNQAQLSLEPEGNGVLHGILQFNALPQPGSYYVRGSVDPANNSVMLKYTGWLYRPPGNWIPLDIDANVDPDDGVMSGRLRSGMCTAFELHKVR